MMDIIDLSAYKRWDIVGVDGLRLAKEWFGAAIDRIAPFQSLETTLEDSPCSVLRLCEGNFRISIPDPSRGVKSTPHHRVWVKQLDWLSAIAFPDSALANLQTWATPKPPYRLSDLTLDCAIPARMDSIAVLIWRHSLCHQPVVEIHTAEKDLHWVRGRLQSS